jgi:hypothetical protein
MDASIDDDTAVSTGFNSKLSLLKHKAMQRQNYLMDDGDENKSSNRAFRGAPVSQRRESAKENKVDEIGIEVADSGDHFATVSGRRSYEGMDASIDDDTAVSTGFNSKLSLLKHKAMQRQNYLMDDGDENKSSNRAFRGAPVSQRRESATENKVERDALPVASELYFSTRQQRDGGNEYRTSSSPPRAFLIESRRDFLGIPQDVGVVKGIAMGRPQGVAQPLVSRFAPDALASPPSLWDGAVDSSLDLGDLDQRTQHLLSKCDAMLANIRSAQQNKEQQQQREHYKASGISYAKSTERGGNKTSVAASGSPQLSAAKIAATESGASYHGAVDLDLSGSLESYLANHEVSTASKTELGPSAGSSERLYMECAPMMSAGEAEVSKSDDSSSSIVSEGKLILPSTQETLGDVKVPSEASVCAPSSEPSFTMGVPASSQSQELQPSVSPGPPVSVDKSGDVFLFLSTSSLGDIPAALSSSLGAKATSVADSAVQTEEESPYCEDVKGPNSTTTATKAGTDASKHPIPSEILAYLDSKLEEYGGNDDDDDSRSLRSEDVREFIARAQRFAPDVDPDHSISHSEGTAKEAVRSSIAPPPPPPEPANAVEPSYSSSGLRADPQTASASSTTADSFAFPADAAQPRFAIAAPPTLSRLTPESIAPYLDDEVVRLLWKQLCEVRTEMKRRLATMP